MSDLAIKVQDISKKYKLGSAKLRHDTLKDQLANSVKGVFGRFRAGEKSNEVVWVLKNVSFELQQGELVGIIGSNGAGKSTLLKILSRITAPTRGRFEICGRVSSLLEVGTGFQAELTGRENIFLNGAILGMSRRDIKGKFDEIVAFAETGKFIDTPVKRYSSGMYVRLAFAVAAHLEPEILLVDEVLAVGDSSFQKKSLGKMSEISREGRTVILISHNMVAVNSLCRRVIWLNNGEIAQDGPSPDVVKAYLSEAVRNTDLAEERWDNPSSAPGNDLIRFHRIAVRREDGCASEPIAMETPFQVVVEYWNGLPGGRLHVTLHLYTADHVIAFATGSINNNEPMPSGLFRSICYIPGDLLNSGQHRFVVLAVKDTSTVIYEYQSRVAFDVLDLSERKGTWYGKEPGAVLPILKWTTEYLGETADNS